MLERHEWLSLAQDLDWEFSYVDEREVFPEEMSGRPWRHFERWAEWSEPYKTSYREYVCGQASKNASIYAVRDAIGQIEDFQKLSSPWLSALKLYGASFTLAEFAAAVGNLRSTRFGRTGAWRTMANLGALDEIRHTEIPLIVMHELVKWDPQFDWIHRFYHTDNWVAIAARHLIDELLLGTDAIEFSIATHFVFETGFTNLQFIGLASLASSAGDQMFEEMSQSIQTDEARHAQIGPPVLQVLIEEDKEYAQYLVDKWFWRSWHLFSVVTGFSMDYLTPLSARGHSFKEFMQEWVSDQYFRSIEAFGLEKPWYWDAFCREVDCYHHKVYASAYTYRSTVWFDMQVPCPEQRQWLLEKYPQTWPGIAPIWQKIDQRWQECEPGIDFGVHGMTIIGFCELCQLVLCGGSMQENSARVVSREDEKFVFCSEPCQWIFEKQAERYKGHEGLVKKVMREKAPGNLLAMLNEHFDLDYEDWGKDCFGGAYPWLNRLNVAKERALK